MRRATATAALGAVIATAVSACGGGGSAKPAERHLVYVQGTEPANAHVWVAGVDGAHARLLTRGQLGLLSPDGRTVAVSRGRKGIYLVPAAGGQARRLTARTFEPRDWSPDGKTLVVTAGTSRSVYELAGIDTASKRVHVIARGSLYGFDFSPKGDEIVYSRAPEATYEGICGDQFDLYKAKLDGGSPTRLTHDGLSAFPVWGPSLIAYSHFPAEHDQQSCSSPGVWTVDPDGSDAGPVIDRAPDSIVMLGFYGFQPLAWLDDTRVLVGLRSDTGTEGAVLDTRSRRLKRLNRFADVASSDGRFYAGSGGDLEPMLSVTRLADGRRIFSRKNACCPSWNR